MKNIVVFVLLMISIKVASQQPVATKNSGDKGELTVYESADKQPEFPGGINIFRQKFSSGIKSSKIIGKGFVSAEAQFIIDRDGEITDIRVKGENYTLNEEIKNSLLSLSKTKWSPAEINGNRVRYRFRLPVKMNIE